MATEEKLEEISSELAFIGEQLATISKCLKKMAKWDEEDEANYSDIEDDEMDDEELDDEDEEEDEEEEETI